MPPLYKDFAEAFAEFYTYHQVEVFPSTLNATLALDDVVFYGFIEDGFWALADAVYWLINGLIYHATYGIIDETYGAHAGALYWAGQGDGGVDMDSILSAMITADYDQLQKFVGIEDAYRSAIWDQPFNIEFYAALARGFRP